MKAEEPKENYGSGWVKIYRSVTNKSWFKKGNYFKLWCYMIIKATHKNYSQWFDGESIELNAGQFITGRKKIAEETGIHESSIERMLTYFEKIEQQIEQQKTSTSRLISIVNWTSYQTSEQQIEQRANNERTTDEQPVNTIQEQNTYKNKKNLKNKENLKLIFPYDSENFMRTWNILVKEKKWRNKSQSALQVSLKKLSRHSEHDAIQMIENCIAGGWMGLVELKQNSNGKQNSKITADGLKSAFERELEKRGESPIGK